MTEQVKNNHDTLTEAFQTYLDENARFTSKGIKASASRARKALGVLRKAAGDRRKEIMVEKAALSEKT
ncbi:MAG: hypothetical protein EXR40_05975 [Nitrosomonadaceae bacterium]|nr:hypothetical protein [Nitrosomonadaceae bacterium]